MPDRIRAGMLQATRRRCHWAQSDAMARYHDEEWGVPVHEDRCLFEFLILEGAQAGLSWETVLRKRERYREVSTASTLPKSRDMTLEKCARCLPIRASFEIA